MWGVEGGSVKDRAGGVFLAGLLIAGVAPAQSRAAEPTLEQVIERHVEARGGRERWAGIRGLEIRGSLTYLSHTGPFALWLGPHERYRLESTQHGQTTLTAWDGEVAWRGSTTDTGAVQRVGGVDRAMIVRDAGFPTPLFDHEKEKYRLKLLGRQDRDGTPVIAIEVTRPDGYAETWYLDPETYLDVGRDSPGSAFGELVPMRTYHDDFRSVEGIQLPFRIESQWNVQERVLTVQEVQVDVALDDARFHPPRPPGMEPLEPLVGTWHVVASTAQHPGAPWQSSERSSTIERRLGGALLEEHYATPSGHEVVRSFSYDRYRKEYRITEISDGTNYLDVQEGTIDAQGRLVTSNLDTGTPIESGGRKVYVRMTLSGITKDGFQIEKETSMDGGATWNVAARSTYTRRKSGAS
jgi:hypothetical protein